MKFKRSTRRSSGSPATIVRPTQRTTHKPIKLNLKTIDNRSKKATTAANQQNFKRKGLHFKFFDLEGKENRLLVSKPAKVKSPTKEKSPKRSAEDALSDRMARGLNLWASTGSMPTEAKPIPKPVLSFKNETQNYFKRSFSMRSKSSAPLGAYPPTKAAEVELKTATIRKAFGKSLTSKKFSNRSIHLLFSILILFSLNFPSNFPLLFPREGRDISLIHLLSGYYRP